MPVKSSMVSAAPEGRPVRVVVTAVRTPVCVKSTARPPALVMALFKFRFRPIHWLTFLESVRLMGTETVVSCPAGREHTAPETQEPPEPVVQVIVEEVVLTNTLAVAEVAPKVTFNEVKLTPAGTLAASTRSTESVCKRVASTEVLTRLSVVVPEDATMLMLLMGKVKLRRLMPVGGVSHNVMVTGAVPPPPPEELFFSPLQESRGRTAVNSRTRRNGFQLMQAPQLRFRVARDASGWTGIPENHCTPQNSINGFETSPVLKY
jgi:hypothetical protein